MSSTEPPPYTPAGWSSADGWEVEVTENNTVVLSPLPSTFYCSTNYDDILSVSEYDGYILSKSNPKLCNKKADCSNKLDEVDCPVIGFLAVMSISLCIVFVGAGFFLISSYFRILNFRSNNKTLSRTGTNIAVE